MKKRNKNVSFILFILFVFLFVGVSIVVGIEKDKKDHPVMYLKGLKPTEDKIEIQPMATIKTNKIINDGY